MLKLIKNFFDDSEKIIGLCAFNKRTDYSNKTDFFFYKDFNKNKFVPRVDNNILLI